LIPYELNQESDVGTDEAGSKQGNKRDVTGHPIHPLKLKIRKEVNIKNFPMKFPMEGTLIKECTDKDNTIDTNMETRVQMRLPTKIIT
jgi:hypothetical protein